MLHFGKQTTLIVCAAFDFVVRWEIPSVGSPSFLNLLSLRSVLLIPELLSLFPSLRTKQKCDFSCVAHSLLLLYFPTQCVPCVDTSSSNRSNAFFWLLFQSGFSSTNIRIRQYLNVAVSGRVHTFFLRQQMCFRKKFLSGRVSESDEEPSGGDRRPIWCGFRRDPWGLCLQTPVLRAHLQHPHSTHWVFFADMCRFSYHFSLPFKGLCLSSFEP